MPTYTERIEKEKDEADRRLTRRLTKGVAAVALATTAVTGGFIAGRATDGAPSKSEVIRIAQTEADNRAEAERYAQLLSDSLNGTPDNRKGGAPDVTILYGTVHDSDDVGRLSRRNPILLNSYSDNGQLKVKADGTGLNGAFLGVPDVMSDGTVHIAVIPYDVSRSTFVPSDPNHILVVANAYASAGKEGQTVFAYDPLGSKTMQNPDHTPLVIGQLVGAK